MSNTPSASQLQLSRALVSVLAADREREYYKRGTELQTGRCEDQLTQILNEYDAALVARVTEIVARIVSASGPDIVTDVLTRALRPGYGK